MSVIEFFTNYWDWYLLIGFIQASAHIISTKEDGQLHWSLIILGYVIAGIGIILIWPIVILSGVRTYYQKKFDKM